MILLKYLFGNSKPNMCFTAEQKTLIKKAKAGKLKLNIINQDDVTCEKCDKFVPEKYYSGECGDEWWVECIHTGWYCPDHSPTSNCDDMDCQCCNPDEEEEDEEEECKEWCEVGEHYVDADEMWEDFADCKNCVSEKEYQEFQQDEEEEKTVDYDKYPKNTHQLICRSCGMPDYYENIADDPNDDQYGMCGECE